MTRVQFKPLQAGLDLLRNQLQAVEMDVTAELRSHTLTPALVEEYTDLRTLDTMVTRMIRRGDVVSARLMLARYGY